MHHTTLASLTLMTTVADATRAASVRLAVGGGSAGETTSITIVAVPLIHASTSVAADAAKVFEETIVFALGALTVDSDFASLSFESGLAHADTRLGTRILASALSRVTAGYIAGADLTVGASVTIEARAQ